MSLLKVNEGHGLTRPPTVATYELVEAIQPATHPSPALSFESVTKTYDGVAVVDSVSFNVEPGTVCGLIGPNGAGKSTLLRILLGLVQPDTGHATIGGCAYSGHREPMQIVGTVLDGTGVAARETAAQHLNRTARYLDLPKTRVGEVLETVGLHDAANKRTGGYSLGMGQRLALANALLARPTILVLDEPTNGLDPEGIHWLRHLVQDFAAGGGTVMVSSHQLMDLQQVVDKVVILQQSVQFEGSLEELGIDPTKAGALEEMFLSMTRGTRS